VISMEDWITIRNMKKRNPGMEQGKLQRNSVYPENTVKNALNQKIPQNIKRDIYKPRTGTIS